MCLRVGRVSSDWLLHCQECSQQGKGPQVGVWLFHDRFHLQGCFGQIPVPDL